MIAPLFTLEPGAIFRLPTGRTRYIVKAHRPDHTDVIQLQHTRDAGWIQKQWRSFRPLLPVVEVKG